MDSEKQTKMAVSQPWLIDDTCAKGVFLHVPCVYVCVCLCLLSPVSNGGKGESYAFLQVIYSH